MTRNRTTPTPAAAAPAASPVAAMTPAQIAAALAALTPDQRKAVREEGKAMRAQDPAKGTLAYAFEDGLLQLDIGIVANAAQRKATGDGRAYLFNIDASTIVDGAGKKWKLSAIFATEVR